MTILHYWDQVSGKNQKCSSFAFHNLVIKSRVFIFAANFKI